MVIWRRPRRLRFNEAEASLPRNTYDVAFDQLLIRNASMRPRQACLGILVFFVIMIFFLSCFNEAEASLPRNTQRVIAVDE